MTYSTPSIETGSVETIGVIGLGYVGIPLALRIVESGKQVIGFDINGERVAQLNNGTSPIKHIPDSKIEESRRAGFYATDDLAKVGECDALLICVPTPLNRTREPDLSFVENTMKAIADHLRQGQILSLESTTWPGTTEEILKPYVDAAGLKVGEDFFLVYSPEREDPGRTDYTTKTIPKVVGGVTENCAAKGQELYSIFIDHVVPVSSARAAEMVKLLENIHRSVNIGLVNEMKIVCDKMGIDVFEVIEAASTKPFGFKAYYPGPGIGGHCIPVDPFYLTWKAREYGINTRFIELAGEVNHDMPTFVVQKVISALNSQKKAINGSRILALGIAYKADVDDMRESPAVLVMEQLEAYGADLDYSDPYFEHFPTGYSNFFMSSVELTAENIKEYDAVILLTGHSSFDYQMIQDNAALIVDTRGKFPRKLSKVWLA